MFVRCVPLPQSLTDRQEYDFRQPDYQNGNRVRFREQLRSNIFLLLLYNHRVTKSMIVLFFSLSIYSGVIRICLLNGCKYIVFSFIRNERIHNFCKLSSLQYKRAHLLDIQHRFCHFLRIRL